MAGISGITLIVGSMILIMLNNDFFNFEFVPMRNVLYATVATMGGIFGGFALLFIAGPRITKTKFFSRVALMDTQDSSQGYVTTSYKEEMKGKKGTAYTVLRPSGKIKIDDQLFDAYTRGEYIEIGTTIEVVNDEGTSLQVKTSV